MKTKIGLAVLTAIAIASVLFLSPQVNPGSLTVVTYGAGAWHDSQKEHFIRPFQEETGVRIDSIAWKADFSKLQLSVENETNSWDVVEVTDSQFERGKSLGLFAKIAADIPSENFSPNDLDEYGVANVYWSIGFVHKLGNTSTELTWKDFWDVEKFPGDRALNDDPKGNLEFALIADGVETSDLYPLDTKRAFAALERLRPAISVWWTDGMQPMQLVDSGRVTMSTIWPGRLYVVKNEYPSLRLEWRGSAHLRDFWVIPRTSKNQAIANQFLSFVTQPQRMGKQVVSIGYGPTNKQSLSYIDEEVRPWTPTAHTDKGFVMNVEWWAKNEAAVLSQWLEWRKGAK
jgi:putative spermidine/putrescine transport system substrate-binding protein